MFFLNPVYAAARSLRSLRSKYIEGETNSRIHHFLPDCIAFNQSALRQSFYQSALRHEQLKNVTPWNRRPFSRRF